MNESKLLREIADMCEHASLTGALSGGAGRVAHRYNAILERMVASGRVPTGMFEPLPETAEYGEIGVEARMLSAAVKEDKKESVDDHILLRLAPFVRGEDLTDLIRQQMRTGTRFDLDMLTHLAPFMEGETLTGLLKEHLRTPPPPPTPPAPREEAPPEPAYIAPTAPAPTEDRVAVLLDRLKDPRLSSEERGELIDRVRELTS